MSVQDQAEYEDLLGLWSDLEAGLGILLGSPASIQEFEQRVWQYDRWMQTLLERDADVGLYLLFQLATNSSVGYSTSHALICTVLCHLIAGELKLGMAERNSLVHAAMTMNIAMTQLQDALALQTEPLAPEQQDAIRALRKHMSLTQMEFAEEMGVRRQTVSEWENGVYEPDRSTSKFFELLAKHAQFEIPPPEEL